LILFITQETRSTGYERTGGQEIGILLRTGDQQIRRILLNHTE
jgi:hypothetical protein